MKNILERGKNTVRNLRFPTVFQWLFGAWCFSASLLLCISDDDFSGLSFATGYSLTGLFLLVLFFALIGFVLMACFEDKQVELIWLGVSAVFLSVTLASKYSGDAPVWFWIAVMIPLSLIVTYAALHLRLVDRIPENRIASLASVCTVFAVSAVLLSMIGILRYRTYSTPNFDFGIFAQMFHNMKTSFSPIVTCERDRLLSHFAIHFSPACYLLLPFYMICPRPETLQVFQGVSLAAGIFPLYFIAKRHKMSEKRIILFSLIYFFYAVFWQSMFYDFHENCLLLPFLLLMICFFDGDHNVAGLLSVLLVCAVKEDAAFYVIIFGIYMMISQKKVKWGAATVALAGVYFVTVLALLRAYGEGVMEYRYEAYIPEGGGLLDAVWNVLKDPGLALVHVFNKPEKFLYVLELLLPLGFLPFVTKKFSRYLLIAPILMNILTDYPYQYQLQYQYHFAITAFLLYLTVLNLSECESVPAQKAFSWNALAAALIFFILIPAPRFGSYAETKRFFAERYATIDRVLEEIPDDASVTASTFLLPHVADRAELYEVYYHKGYTTEYCVLDMRPGYAADSMKYLEGYLANGYEIFIEEEDAVIVLKRK